MRKMMVVAMCAVVLVALSGSVRADNVTDLLQSAEQNYQSGKYAKALEDLEWAKKEISKRHLEELKKYLPANVEGYTQEDPSTGSMMAVNACSRTYTQVGTGNTIEVNIISAGAESGMGAFMGMAAAMGAMGGMGGEMILSHGKRGSLVVDAAGKSATATFTLARNVIVTIEGNGFTDGEEVKRFAQLIDLAALEQEFQ
jgi:hypothetical protein